MTSAAPQLRPGTEVHYTTAPEARRLGRAWADARAANKAPTGPWRGDQREAIGLIYRPDNHVARAALARVAIEAAAVRWSELCIEPERAARCKAEGALEAAREDAQVADAGLRAALELEGTAVAAASTLRAFWLQDRAEQRRLLAPPRSEKAEHAVLVEAMAGRWVSAMEELQADDFAEPLRARVLVLADGAQAAGFVPARVVPQLERVAQQNGWHVHGYLRGLAREALAGRKRDGLKATLKLLDLGRQRRALAVAAQAVAALRNPAGCDHGATVALLRRAAELLEGSTR